MENDQIYKSTAERIINSGYEKAEDMYSNWAEYVSDIENGTDFLKSVYFNDMTQY